jgi:predicted DsbA family dithiol-disulfide isomerase
MQVDIWSDVVCPWCYIGRVRFEKALELLSAGDRAEIQWSWKPYQLDPTAPRTPSPVIDVYARKFGGPQKAFSIIDHVTKTAAEDGIEFHLDVAQRANTFDAHRLLWMALTDHGPQVQHRLKGLLLADYFTHGRDVADRTVLRAAALAAGLDEARVDELLDGDRGAAETRAELNDAHELGITGVPSFVIEGTWSIPGAQDPETIARVLERLLRKRREQRGESATDVDDSASTDAAACAVDGANC